jgi:hypothetical protein
MAAIKDAQALLEKLRAAYGKGDFAGAKSTYDQLKVRQRGEGEPTLSLSLSLSLACAHARAHANPPLYHHNPDRSSSSSCPRSPPPLSARRPRSRSF